MKKTLIFSLTVVLCLPLLALGCRASGPVPPAMPALKGGQEAALIEISYDEFSAQNHMTRNIELIWPGSLIVRLYSNPTTGFQWTESANISSNAVIIQESHVFVPPQAQSGAPVAGAGGKEVWVFNTVKEGTSTIKMSYNRPWEGGEKNVWTLTLNLTVK